MSRHATQSVVLACLLGLATGLTGAAAARLLPTDLSLALVAWLLVSVPLGVGIGPCIFTGR
jgi:hypothetical protein